VQHDPPTAVFGGVDGLSLMPAVAAVAAALLRPGGTLVVEHSEDHAAAMLELFSAAGWESTHVRADLPGCDRFVITRRAARFWSANPLYEGG
jgi:release factor glutamine methyltransferase